MLCLSKISANWGEEMGNVEAIIIKILENMNENGSLVKLRMIHF